MNKETLKVSINGEEVEVYNLNKVEEFGSEGSLTGFLMQVSLPSKWREEKENLLDIQIDDLILWASFNILLVTRGKFYEHKKYLSNTRV